MPVRVLLGFHFFLLLFFLVLVFVFPCPCIRAVARLCSDIMPNSNGPSYM